MKIDLVDGLLQTSITINYMGQALTVDKLVIDTGASHTLLSADAVADIGVYFETGDEIVSTFGIGGEESCFRKSFDAVTLHLAPYDDDYNRIVQLNIYAFSLISASNVL